MDDFEKELKIGFLEEAAQMLADAEQCFLALETSPNDNSILEKIFRVAHNLKGSAKAVGFMQIGEFAHQLESYLLKLKDKTIEVTSVSAGLLLRCNDHLTNSVQTLKENLEATIDNGPLFAEIQAHLSGEHPAPAPKSKVALDILSQYQIPAASQFPPEEEEVEATVASNMPQLEAPSPSGESPSTIIETTSKELPELLASETETHLDQPTPILAPVPLPPQEVEGEE